MAKTETYAINLSFGADTKKIKAELAALEKQLSGLLSSTNLSKELNEAIPKVAELSAHLKNATNVDTGNLDFSKLNKSLKQSGTTLQQYGASLQKIGPQGQQAFLQLTKAISSAEVPIRRTNKMVTELGKTLANTARWQLSSSVLHGFMGALQGAYGYAQDLNSALNDIQIVTNLNANEMANFAKEANKAAQALSTTTVEYTKASLIYFQQGLSTQQVKERADVTVKMANVTKQSAEAVSNQLTSIWSNFYDGTKSLESYADALTALGAATASSSDEISAGLQKFAAVADTVGLSYEYAASALATLTANTRESADVVGTALKTLFARIQGLQLGETLDDGTTLNKYSEALNKVGVNILDTSGSLKSMDTILDEIGAKWQKLGRDQQQALAQTVAGVRQYNQFMALMNNWNNGDGDSMQANLRTVQNSSGALDQQADIYAKSWEAARDRVTAAMESIYDKLLKDEFFIDLTNGVEKVISFVDLLIDRLGGLQGVLFSIGAIATQIFSKQIAQGLTNVAYNISMSTKKGQQRAEDERIAFLESAKASVQTNPDYISKSEKASGAQIQSSIELQQLYLDNVSKMTTREQELNKILIDRTGLMREQAVTAAKNVETTDLRVEAASIQLRSHLRNNANIADLNNDFRSLRDGQKAILEIQDTFKSLEAKMKNNTITVDEFKAAIAKIGEGKSESFKPLIKGFADIDMNAADAEEEIAKLLEVIQRINNTTVTRVKSQLQEDDPEGVQIVDEMTEAIRKQTQATYDSEKAEKAAKQAHEATEQAIKSSTGTQKEWADIIVESVNLALSVASAFSMISSAITTLSDPDVSGWEKFVTVLTTLSMLIPTLISVFKTLQSALSTETLTKVANTIATWKMAQADKKAAEEKEKAARAAKKNGDATSGETVKKTISEKFGDFKEKSKQGWDSFTKPMKERSNAWNKSIWDKISEADKDAAIKKFSADETREKLARKKMKKKGYTLGADGNYHTNKKGLPQTITSKSAEKQAVQQAAMKSVGGKAFGSMAGGAGLIAAGIAVAVGAIAWGVHQFTKYDKAAEEAAERSRQAAEAFQSVSDAYQSFTGNLSGYEEANKGLEGLVKGTIEYKEALLQANESAQALIESTKGMDNELKFGVDYDIDSDGRIKIKEESLERVQQEKLDNMQKASANKQVMAISAQRKQAEADSIKLQRENIKSWGGIGASIGNVLAATGAGMASGAGVGAGIGLLGGPIGVGAGAGIGTLIGGITGLITGIGGQIAAGGAAVKKEEEAIKEITETFDPSVFQDQGKYEEAIRELKIDDGPLVESLVKNREAMQELAKNVQEANAATKALNKQMVTAALADNKKVQDGKHAEDVIATVSTFFEEDQKTETQSLIEQGWGTEGINKGTKVNKEVERVFEEYAKAAGLEGAKVTDTIGTDKNREFIYEIDGKEVKVSLDDMREVVARQKATDAANTRAEKLTEIFNEFTDEQSAAVTAAKTGEFTNLNLGQIWGKAVTVDSLGLSDDDLKALGYDSATTFNNAFVKAQNAGLASLDSMTLPKDLFGIEKLSVEEATKVSNVFKEINLGPQGEKAGKEFTYGLNKMLINVKPEDQDDALKALMDVDWSSWDALEQASIVMEDFGVHINASSVEWKTFVETMRTATGAMPDYSHIKQDLTEITAILEDLDFGSVISEDDYNRLIEYNNAWKDFFQLQANGTRKFIGNSNTMLEATRDRIQEERKELQKDVEIQNKLLKHWGSRDWDSYGTNTKGLNDLLGFYNNEFIGADTQAVLNSFGYNEDVLKQIQTEANQGNTQRLIELYSRLSKLQNATYISDDKGLEEQMASTARTYEDLDKLFAAGQIGSSKTGKANETTTYEKQVNDIANSAIQAAESLEELNDAKAEGEKYNADIDNDIYNESLERIAENAYNSAETLEDLISTNSDFSKTTLDSTKRTELYNENLEKLAESAYGAAKDLDDLNSINTQYTNANLDSAKRTELYRDSLINLGKSYNHAKDELKEYEKAIKDNNTTAIASTELQLKNAITLGEVANELGLNADELNKLTSNLSKGFGEGFENALKYAQGYLILAEKLGISVEDLQNNLSDLTEAFSSLTYAEIDTLFNNIASAAEQSNLDINELTKTTIEIGDALNLSADKALNTATMFMTASEESGLSTEELVFQTQELASSLNISSDKAAKLAVQNQRMNKGVSTLASNWEGWKKTLNETDKTSTDYAKTMIELTDTVRDLVGAGEEFTLTSEFVTTNMELIEDAAEGDIKAINKLGIATAKAAVEALEMDDALKTTIQSSLKKDEADPFAGFADFDTNVTTVQTGLQTLFDSISNGTLTAGQSITALGEDWITAFNQMALQTGMSVDEMNSLLNQMGVDAEVKVTEVKTKTKVPVYETRENVIDDGSQSGLRVTQTSSSIIKYDEMDSVLQVPSINGESSITYTGNGNISTSAKASGGSTTAPAKAEKKEFKERYETSEKTIKKADNEKTDAERDRETSYGKTKTDKIDIINAALESKSTAINNKKSKAEDYLSTDKSALQEAFKAATGEDIGINETTNQVTTDMEAKFKSLEDDYNTNVDNYNTAIDQAMSDGVITAAEQKSLDTQKEALDEQERKINELKSAYSQYEDTLNTVVEAENEMLDIQNEIKANNYQKIIEELDGKLELLSDELSTADYYLDKLSDDFYSMAEAAGHVKGKIDDTQTSLSVYNMAYEDLQSKYNQNEITDQDYVEGLKKIRDGYRENLESLNSLDDEMLNYYSNTLSMASDEITKYTDQMDHLSSVLDHYQSLMGIMGKEADYEQMNVILTGIATTARNAKEASEAEYEFYSEQVEAKKALLDEAEASGDEAAAELYRKEWEAASEKAREAQDKMLSDTAAWAEAEKATIENSFKDYAKTLEEALTGGISFDELSTSMERAASLQEEYLTSTNQAYETQKMIRTAQKAIDESSNSITKQKLKAFQEETQQLQSQSRLSKYELELQQAQYDLLLAEIALEDAQSAKSTVRLQRDAEGNFGYVYTADSSQVADAEQKVADAQNALYNKQLDGANNYTQKYQQTLQEMYDSMTSLQEQYLNGEIATQEEYERRRDEAQEHYYAKLQDYANLYGVAITETTTVTADAWSTEFATMMNSTDEWQSAVTTYVDNCSNAFTAWGSIVSEIEKTTGNNLTSLSAKVKGITDESTALKDALIGEDGLIDKLGEELTAVNNVTSAYAAQRDTIKELISQYETYLSTINSTIASKSGWTINITSTPSNTDITGMASGGYTGEWGPEGKLAVLHQKELVLNSQDTENLLAAVDTLRVILNTIDTHSMSAQIGGMLSTPGFTGGNTETIEQNVKIEASFPRVQDRNEIEEAFNNLINRASQYANRK